MSESVNDETVDATPNFIESLTDEQLDALYDKQYGAHSGAHQVYGAGRGELPELCSSCATEQAIEREQERRRSMTSDNSDAEARCVKCGAPEFVRLYDDLVLANVHERECSACGIDHRRTFHHAFEGQEATAPADLEAARQNLWHAFVGGIPGSFKPYAHIVTATEAFEAAVRNDDYDRGLAEGRAESEARIADHSADCDSDPACLRERLDIAHGEWELWRARAERAEARERVLQALLPCSAEELVALRRVERLCRETRRTVWPFSPSVDAAFSTLDDVRAALRSTTGATQQEEK